MHAKNPPFHLIIVYDIVYVLQIWQFSARCFCILAAQKAEFWAESCDFAAEYWADQKAE